MIDTRTTEETMKTTTYRNIPASTETRTESERKMAVELQAPIHQVREYLMVRACEPAAEQEEIA